jgi:hypothetical protein
MRGGPKVDERWVNVGIMVKSLGSHNGIIMELQWSHYTVVALELHYSYTGATLKLFAYLNK